MRERRQIDGSYSCGYPKAVIVPDLDQLPGEAAVRHELAGVVELLSGYSVDEVCVMTGLDACFVHAVYVVYYGGR